MTTIGVSVANTEFDAAQALLDLQSNVRESNSEQRDSKYVLDCNEDRERSAKFFLSCFIASKVNPIVSQTTIQNVGTLAHPVQKLNEKDPNFKKSPKRVNNNLHDSPAKIPCVAESTNKRSKIFKRNPIKYSHQPDTLQNQINSPNASKTPRSNCNNEKKTKTRNVATQTEDNYQLPIIETMELTIKRLCDKIKSLEEQIKSNSLLVHSRDDDISDDGNDLADDADLSYESKDDDWTMTDSHIPDSDVEEEFNSDTQDNDPDYTYTEETKSTKVLRNSNVNYSNNSNDMVSIGEGNAQIPSRIFRHINWNSYTSATRKLLTAVFSRKVLATHSLTGKPSPAFPNKPAKKKLDSALVNDIVQTVVEMCHVPENVVRTSITTKCADESKMFRTRVQNKKKRKYKLNRENIPPESDSDDV